MALISVIVPMYNEEDNLSDLYARLLEVTRNSGNEFEFIFVDDGSSDNSFSIVHDLSVKDSRIKIIKFSRNFGSHAACLAGLEYSTGDACTFIAADLQDPPELIQSMIDAWNAGCDVVIGVRERHQETSRFFPRLYYSLVRRFALSNMPAGGTDVFLVNRKVADAVISLAEKNTSIFGLILWSGFNQTVIRYKKLSRHRGTSKWTLGKKIKLFLDTFVSFSYLPIRLISMIGILFALSGFLYAFFIIFNRLFRAIPVEGWSSTMVVLLVVSGVQLIMLGIIGEYLWRNFDESRKRPCYIVDSKVGFDS